MNSSSDIVSVKGLACDCEIGIRDGEKGILQKLIVDFDAEVLPVETSQRDREDAMHVDYSVAAPGIIALLKSQRFNLIETVAEDIAAYLFKNFSVKAVDVTVSKFPLDMPYVASVGYRCRRIKNS